MTQTALKRDASYTYADYLQWDDGERWELIHGVAYPAHVADLDRLPRRHQDVAVDLLSQFANHLLGKQASVYIMPFEVRLPVLGVSGVTNDTTSTVVQPDLVVVCDPSMLDDRGCKGAPDLVIEILSPDSVARDQKEKFLLYEQAGVLEYWLVHPTDRIVTVFHRGADGAYGRPAVYTPGESIRVGILPELEIDLAAVFGD
jgi:Uma2 family endonuclease